jgi:hypothetical protein
VGVEISFGNGPDTEVAVGHKVWTSIQSGTPGLTAVFELERERANEHDAVAHLVRRAPGKRYRTNQLRGLSISSTSLTTRTPQLRGSRRPQAPYTVPWSGSTHDRAVTARPADCGCPGRRGWRSGAITAFLRRNGSEGHRRWPVCPRAVTNCGSPRRVRVERRA